MIIHVDNLSFTYGGTVAGGTIDALRNISFTVAAGERVALTGHNGSGKSTLVRQLNGLLKPSSGKVLIDGCDTDGLKTAQLAGKVALLFQNPDDQICKRTVWDEVVFGPKNLGYAAERITTLAEEALASFELTASKDKNPHDFGYSERKRIAMASIVAMDTPVLVFDEPTAGLDPHEIALLVSTLDTLQAANKTVIIISHDMDFVAENITRTIALAGGRKVFDGATREIFAQEEIIEDSGLLQPQVVQLGNACNLGHLTLSPDECATELVARFSPLAGRNHGSVPDIQDGGDFKV